MSGLLTWPTIKGAGILSSSLVFATFVSDRVANEASQSLGRDTSISLEAACVVGGVILTFSIWINRQFNTIGKAADCAKAAAFTAEASAKDAHLAALTMTSAVIDIKKQLSQLPCHKLVCKIKDKP